MTGRGLEVVDREMATRTLFNSSYYRLSGYARQFQVSPRSATGQTFEPGTTFETVVAAHDHDEQLSALLLDALCVIERSLRARFAYHLAHQHGNQAFYLDPVSYLAVTPHLSSFLDKLEGELSRARRPTVARYAVADDYSAVPVWVALEVFSFGSMSKILEYLVDDRAARAVAASYSVPWGGFTSTVHSLAVLRNTCAHHGQLWHRRLDVQTPVQRKTRRHEPAFDSQGPYAAVIAIKRFLLAIDPADQRAARVRDFFESGSPFVSGFLSPAPR